MKPEVCLKARPSPKAFFIILLLLTVGCATDRPPSGGPPDNAPLRITDVQPEASLTDIQPETIRFTFNRYVPTASLRRSIVFSPRITGYEIRGDGEEAVIIFNEPFEQNRTYSISFNTSLQSSRGNELEKSYTYAFSTGPFLDSGEIEGTVYTRENKPARGALIYAFLREPQQTQAEQSILERHPDYVVQTGTDGTFRFNHLKKGSYRLMAFMDKDGNRILNLNHEAHASGTIENIPTGSRPLLFRMSSPHEEERQSAAAGKNAPQPTDPGAIIGTIRTPHHAAVIEAVNTTTGTWYRTTAVNTRHREQSFVLKNLPAGRYLVSAYLPGKDIAADGSIPQWSPGNIWPFRPADELVIHPDPVIVRKGWTTGNIELNLQPSALRGKEK